MRHSGYASIAAAVALGLVGGVVVWRAAMAQPRCVFLECGPAETPNPAPAKVPETPTQVRLRPVEPPQHEGLARPKLTGEICDEVASFRYCASSVLEPQYGFNYNPRNLVDGDLKTAWVEGKPGNGEGESLVVDLDGPRTITAVQVMNGYHKNERLFLANSRVSVAELQFSNGYTRLVPLADAPGVQTIEVGRQKAEWMRFTIRSVYPGKKYQDTAITELRVVTAE